VLTTSDRLFVTYFKNSPLGSEKFGCLEGVFCVGIYLGFPIGRWEFMGVRVVEWFWNHLGMRPLNSFYSRVIGTF